MLVEIDHFLTYIQENEDFTPNTLAGYGINLRLFALWLEDHHKTLAALTHADMKQYRDELKAKYKPGTINKKLACVSKFLKWCAWKGYNQNDPMAKIKAVKSQDYPKWLTQERVQSLLDAAQKAVDRARSKRLGFTLTVCLKVQVIVTVLLNTGLRVSELCDLQFSDINDQTITVKWGKGSKRREVPMNDQAKAAFELWLKIRHTNSDYIFATSEGRMTRQVVNWHLLQLSKKTGFRVTPHSLRHTFGKSLADKGIALDRIARLMGHSDVNTTAIYTMPSLDDLRQVVKLLD